MERVFTVSHSIDIATDARSLYDAVSDVTRMDNWSPENTGAIISGGHREPFVGMKFNGTNKRGRFRWVTRCTVTAAEPGQRFAFRVFAIGLRKPRLRGRNATWEYRFEAVGDGSTRVTETWHDDRRWPQFAIRAFDWLVTGGTTFAEFQKGNIRRTLQKLKSVMEQR